MPTSICFGAVQAAAAHLALCLSRCCVCVACRSLSARGRAAGHQGRAAAGPHTRPPAPLAAVLQRPGAPQRHPVRHLHQPAHPAMCSAGGRQCSRGCSQGVQRRGAMWRSNHPPTWPPCREQHRWVQSPHACAGGHRSAQVMQDMEPPASMHAWLLSCSAGCQWFAAFCGVCAG